MTNPPTLAKTSVNRTKCVVSSSASQSMQDHLRLMLNRPTQPTSIVARVSKTPRSTLPAHSEEGMFSTRSRKYSIIRDTTHGMLTVTTASAATSLGTKDSVCS